MNPTVVDLVTPHVLRVVDLAHQAEKGMNVDWHLREAVFRTMFELRDHFNAVPLVAAYVQALENAAAQAPRARAVYIGVLQSAVAAARASG